MDAISRVAQQNAFEPPRNRFLRSLRQVFQRRHIDEPIRGNPGGRGHDRHRLGANLSKFREQFVKMLDALLLIAPQSRFRPVRSGTPQACLDAR